SDLNTKPPFSRFRICGIKVRGYLWGPPMKSSIVKRSIIIGGHKTSVSLEDEFWSDLQKIAKVNQATGAALIQEIARPRDRGNLPSGIGLFVLEHFRNQ